MKTPKNNEYGLQEDKFIVADAALWDRIQEHVDQTGYDGDAWSDEQ